MPPKNTNLRWEIINPSRQHESFGAQSQNVAIPAPILTILANRGITDPQDIDNFLNPSLDQLPPPQLLLGLDRAVNILTEAWLRKTPVLVHGDYDADGVTATALLVKFFREINLPVFYHLPNRLNEGYGLNLESLPVLRKLPGIAEHSAPILLTVDCGITNHAEIAAANDLGFRVIVTDHHQPDPNLPAAEAIINPHQPGCTFPFRELAGVGVAFYLAAGLRAEMVRQGVWEKKAQPNLKRFLDLVAIGTVADMVSLGGANRILVKIGLEVINQAPSPGIKALLEQIGHGAGKATSETIAYQMAPRINAAGRTGAAEQALLLLLAEDEKSATVLAEVLGQANQLRKDLSESMYNSARIQAEEQFAAGRFALVVSGEGWSPGIAGLVATKLAREFWRPTVVLVLNVEDQVRGSARSVGKLDILACLRECSAYLNKYGGHPAAAGVSLDFAKVAVFHESLNESVAMAASPTDMEPRLEIDLWADPGEVMEESILNYVQNLGPYGNGNQEPIFGSRPEGVKLSEVKKVGTDSLRFRIEAPGKGLSGIGFGLARWAETAKEGPLCLAYTITRNNFRGNESWEVRLVDVKIPL